MGDDYNAVIATVTFCFDLLSAIYPLEIEPRPSNWQKSWDLQVDKGQ